jgi:ABC-2 type transport system ATP-binding protein
VPAQVFCPRVEYVEKQPTLEDVFLAIVGDSGQGSSDGADTNNGKGT